MELQIELDLDLDVAGRRRDTHALDQRLQIVEVARLYSRLSQVDHGGLEQRAEAVDLAHVLRRERADEGTTVRLDDDQVFGLELAQRLAHGAMADTHLARDLGFREVVAGLVYAREHRLTNGTRNFAAERTPLGQAEHARR